MKRVEYFVRFVKSHQSQTDAIQRREAVVPTSNKSKVKSFPKVSLKARV